MPISSVVQSTTRPTRAGNTVVLTLLMVVVAIGLISLASDNLAANRSLEQIDRQKVTAQFTAESFIALIERKLYDLAARDTALLKTPLTSNEDRWFDLVGFDAGGQPGGSADQALYLNGCAMRWRLEPVKIMAKTHVGADATDASFFVNSERDPNLQHERRELAGPNLIIDEAQHFYFNVVVEAYALTDVKDTTTVPWVDRDSTKYTAMVQAQRVIQFEDVNAFRYLINYVANGRTGDLELFPRSPITLNGGGLHSNERIFFSARDTALTIGSASTPVPVEAADGIFRLHKPLLYENGVFDAEASVAATYNEPLDALVGLNDIPLSAANDSRGDFSAHDQAVRDGLKRDVKEDLDTYQDWNNGFLDNGWTVGPGTRIHRYSVSGAYTIRTQPNPYDPADIPQPVVPVAYATGQPLFRFPMPDQKSTFNDIWPFPPGTGGTVYGKTFPTNPLEDVDLLDPTTGLPNLALPLPPAVPAGQPPIQQQFTAPRIARRTFFDQAIGAGSRRGTALVIRERARQRPGAAYLTNPGLPTEGTISDPLVLQQYNEWLKANYVVYLGRSRQIDADGNVSWITVDITNEFFAYSLTPVAGQVTSVRDLMVHEDVFTNRRDQAWFAAQGQGGLRTNVLTINLTRLSLFLNRNVLLDFPLNVTDPALSVFPSGGNYGSYFTGMIYLERTPRMFLDTSVTPNVPYAHPLLPNGVHPLPTSGLTINSDPSLNPLGAMQPIVGMVDIGATPTNPVGAPGTWTVFPHLLGVRLDRAVNAQGRRMTIVTPNTCYLWGSFNTAGQANAPPTPCAIYADSVVALSNAWTDARSADPTPPVATPTTYRAAIVTHNVPTDRENAAVGGSGGAQNLLRLLENWSGVNFNLVGCLVVPGRMRHTRSTINVGNDTFHMEPNYVYTYNDVLQTSNGQPPYSLKTTNARRVLSNVMR